MSCERLPESVCKSGGNTSGNTAQCRQLESAVFFDEEGIGCGLAIESSVL